MKNRYRYLGAVALLTLSACGHEFEPPDREARVADAMQQFASARFDTVTWTDEAARELDGNGVYAARCRNCHGTLGAGGTDYAAQRGLDVPSLVEPDWRLDGQADSVRFHVYVGHAAGMPNWGVTGLTVREIDAVSFYIVERLRPEILGGG